MNKGYVICKISEKSDTFYGDWDRGRPIVYFKTKKEAHKYVREHTEKPVMNEYGNFQECEKYSYTDLLTWKEYAINDKGKWFNINYS